MASLLLTLAWPVGAERATLSRRTLAVETDRIIGRLPISVSVRVQDRLIYAHHGNLPRTPASNEKLLLSMALLARFRPAYRIPTTIEGPLPRHGIVNGTLWLVGHGDPELNDAALRRLAEALHARGIRAVRGSVTGVTSTLVLTKMLGAAESHPPGTIAKGASAIEDWSRRRGVAIVAHDGSGLSYADKISANGMTRLLAAADTERWGRALRLTLPTAGEGTLAERLGTQRIRAKTGTLLGQVSALSGWLWLRRSRRWAEFSILSHGMSKPQAVAEEDRLVSLIAAAA